jgi:uncharacterized membrane protein (DUF485 family)
MFVAGFHLFFMVFAMMGNSVTQALLLGVALFPA